jgi:hypothetical protein
LGRHPKHKPTLINCGINSWQGKRDYKKARDYINRALSVAGGVAVWDEKSGKLLGAIDAEEARAGQMKAQKEAEAATATADAEKAKAGAAQPQPQGASGPAGAAQPSPQEKPQ